MIKIELEENIWLQFRITIGRITNQIQLSKYAIIEDDTFMILSEDSNEISFGVDLSNSKCFSFKANKDAVKNFRVDISPSKGTIPWGMINMINNAMQEWYNQNPHRGPKVREDLSNQVTSFIGKYGLTFKLEESRICATKYAANITYEQLLNEVKNII